MAKRRADLYCRPFLIYFAFLLFYSKVIGKASAEPSNKTVSSKNLTKGCSIQMHTKLDREPRLAKSEIGSGQQEDVLLSFYSKNGSICIKLDGGLSILVIYKKSNVSKKIDGYIFSRIVPSNAVIEGNCDQEVTSFIRISWNEYSLVWNFAKTPGRKRWYVNQIDLIINTRTEGFRKFAFCGKSFTFSTMEPIFPTPLGYSYRISNKTAVNLSLTDGRDVSPTANFTAKIYLKENFQLQPFMSGQARFGPVFDLENEIYSALGTNRSPPVEVIENATTYLIDDTLDNETYTTTVFPLDLNDTSDSTTDEIVTLNSTIEEGVVYSLHDHGPFRCAMLKTEGLIEISFKSPSADTNTVSTNMPRDAIVEGSCLSNEAWMRVSWDGYSMKWCFVQEDHEGWWVTRIEVVVCAKNKLFQHILINDEPIRLSQSKEKFLHNPPGCTFESEEFVVNLTSHQELYSQFELSGRIILRNFQLAAFLVDDN